MKTDFTIRVAQQSDIVELKDLYKNTVLVINRHDYSQEEVEDWASCGDDLSKIGKMIETHYFIVAVNQQSQLVGFSSITPQGYLHSMFVHKDFQGKGIATILLKEIEICFMVHVQDLRNDYLFFLLSSYHHLESRL